MRRCERSSLRWSADCWFTGGRSASSKVGAPRLRARLPAAGPSGVSEKKMSGGGDVLTHSHLTVGVYGEGGPDALRHTALLLRGADRGGCRLWCCGAPIAAYFCGLGAC